jgi:hypothetical protein
MKNSVSWIVMPCIFIESDILEEHIPSIFRPKSKPTCAGFMLGLLFDAEEGDDMFLRNLGFFPNYTRREKPEDRTVRRVVNDRLVVSSVCALMVA